MARFDLSDEEWAVIEPLLPKDGRGPTRKDDRKVLNGIFCISRNCAPWRDLPEQYGPYTTVYNRYNVWGERGVWKGIFDALTDECDSSLIFVDASIVKAHRAASGSRRGAGERYWTLTQRSHKQSSRGRRPERQAVADRGHWRPGYGCLP